MFGCCVNPDGSGGLAQVVTETAEPVEVKVDPNTPTSLDPTPAQIEAAKKEKAQEIDYAPKKKMEDEKKVQEQAPAPATPAPAPENKPAEEKPAENPAPAEKPAEKPAEEPAAAPAAPAEMPTEGTATIKLVDANGLALAAFGFSTWMFFAFLCNIDNTGNHNVAPKVKPEDNHPGVHYLPHMLTWGVAVGLITAGVFQGMNGDHLGMTSYLFHATILATIGWNFQAVLQFKSPTINGYPAIPNMPGNFMMMSFYCYCAFWFNIVFTIMAFRIAKMFGVLYFTVAVMFLFVGLNWQEQFSDTKAKEYDRTGDYIAGVACLIVALQCFYLFLPVMTGLGVIM